MEWVHYAIPKEVDERIEKDKDPGACRSSGSFLSPRSLSSKIRAALGYPTRSAFLQEAIRRHLNSKEREYDGIQEEREVGRKVLGKKDPGDL